MEHNMNTNFDQVIEQVGESVWYQAGSRVNDQIRSRVCDQVCEQIWTHGWYPVVDLVEDQIRSIYED
jgi:hypothetical protein